MKKKTTKISVQITRFLVITVLILIAIAETVIWLSYKVSDLTEMNLPPAQTGKIELIFTPKNKFRQLIFNERFLQGPGYSKIKLSKRIAWEMVEEFAPIIIHEKGHKPEEDVPISVTFDGDEDPVNNKVNFEAQQTLKPYVYGELTAETVDSYYLTYIFYHVSDYSHPFREYMISSTYHDHDLEGFHLRVDKKQLVPTEAETWFHSRFFYCSRLHSANSRKGSPFFYLNLYKNKNPVIFINKGGHGVRCAQKRDFINLNDKFVFVPSFETREDEAINKKNLNKNEVLTLGYQLENLDIFLKNSFSRDFFSGSVEFSIVGVEQAERNTQSIHLGRFLKSRDSEDKHPLARPKPPWSWDALWDDQPVGEWYFDPARSFSRHRMFYYPKHERLSLRYIRHYSISKIPINPAIPEKFLLVSDESAHKKYQNIKELVKGTRKLQMHSIVVEHICKDLTIKCLFTKSFRRYVNFVFLKLGAD